MAAVRRARTYPTVYTIVSDGMEAGTSATQAVTVDSVSEGKSKKPVSPLSANKTRLGVKHPSVFAPIAI